VQPELRDLRVTLEIPVHKVLPVLKARLARPEPLALKARKVIREKLVLKALKAQRVTQARQALKVPKVRKVTRENKARRDHRALRAPMA